MRKKTIVYREQIKRMLRDNRGHLIGVETHGGHKYSMDDIVVCEQPLAVKQEQKYADLITKQHMYNDRNHTTDKNFTIIPNHTICRVKNKSDYISKSHLLN